jgi:hypothetical protein
VVIGGHDDVGVDGGIFGEGEGEGEGEDVVVLVVSDAVSVHEGPGVRIRRPLTIRGHGGDRAWGAVCPRG